MSLPTVPAQSVLARLYERSGMLAFYEVAEVAPLPTPITAPFPVIDTLHEEILASPGLAVEARTCHLTLRVPDGRAAGELSRVLAPYGARLLLAPTWGRGGRSHVGIIVGLAHHSYETRIRRDLVRLDRSDLVVEPGAWVPAIVPDMDAMWRALAHATRQDGVHVAVDLLSGVDVVALLRQPVTVGHHEHGVQSERFRPSDGVLRLYPRLFLPTGGHVLVLGSEGKAVAAPHVHRLTPWDAVAAGLAYTAQLRPDIAGFDLDSPTAIRAALTVQQQHGLPPIVVWRSGSEGHLGGCTRVAPASMGDLADLVHETEAALCVDRGLPRPDRMVVRGGRSARMRPPGSPSAKPGARVGPGIGLLRGVTEDGEAIIEWLDPDDVPQALGLGERPVAIPPAFMRRGETASAEREPLDQDLARRGINRSREGVVRTTQAAVIARWGLSGEPAMTLTLQRAELLDRTGVRVDASRWVGSLLWALLVRGASDDECIAAVEACQGLALGYKGAMPGTPRMAARVRWECGRVREAIDDGRRAGLAPAKSGSRRCADAVVDRTRELWASWPGGDAARLVTAAAFLGMARDGRRLGRIGVGVRRMGATTGCTPATAAGRLRDLVDDGHIALVDGARFDPVAGWRADRYDLVSQAAGAVAGRPPLEAVLALLRARICWVRGVTPGAVLAMASAMHHGTVSVDDLVVHWGLTRRQARAAAGRASGVTLPGKVEGALGTYDREMGTLEWRADCSLGKVARLTGATKRYAGALSVATAERSLLKVGAAIVRGEEQVAEQVKPFAPVHSIAASRRREAVLPTAA